MEDKRNTKFSYFSDMSWFDGIGTDIPFKNADDDNFNEKWESTLPTRANTTTLDKCDNIIAMFGDSFMYGHGVQRRYTIDKFITDNSKDIKAISFGVPGSGNSNTVRMVNQWFNTGYADKTSAVVFNVAPLPRFDLVISKRYSEYGVFEKTGYWPDLYDETYTNRCIYTNQNGGNNPDLSMVEDRSLKRKMTNIYDSYYRLWDTPINSLISFEHYMIQMYWMCRALDKPFYYIFNEWLVTNFLNKDDFAWLSEKLSNLEKTSKLKRIDISDIHKKLKEEEIYLKCGHWTPRVNRLIADKIYKEYLNDT